MVRKGKRQGKKIDRPSTRGKQVRPVKNAGSARAARIIESELAQVEEELHKMSGLLEELTQGICFFNKEDVIKYGNESFGRITGLDVGLLKGKKLHENQLWRAREQKSSFKSLFQQVKESGSRFTAERLAINSSKVGERVWNLSLIPRKNKSGDYDGMGLIIEDVTGSKTERCDSLTHALYAVSVMHTEIQPLLDGIAGVLKDYSDCSSVRLIFIDGMQDRIFKADSDNRVGLWGSNRVLSAAEISSLFKDGDELGDEYHTGAGSIYLRDIKDCEHGLTGILRKVVVDDSNSYGFCSMTFIPLKQEEYIQGFIQVANVKDDIQPCTISMIESVRGQLQMMLEHTGLKEEIRTQRLGLLRQIEDRGAYLMAMNEHLKQEAEERKLAMEKLCEQIDLIRTLNQVDDFDEALRLCLDRAIRMAGMDCGVICLPDDKTVNLVPAYASGLSPELQDGFMRYAKEMSLMRVINTEYPLYLNIDEADRVLPERMALEGVKALGFIPINFKQELVALLVLAAHETSGISYPARDAVEAMAAAVGPVLVRIRDRCARIEGESCHKALFESTSEPMLVVDEGGNYIDGNDAALSFLECSHAELLTMNVRDTLPPYLDDEWYEKYRSAAGQSGCLMERDYYVWGKIKVLELAITPLQRGERRVFFGIGRDVTESKKAEAAFKMGGPVMEQSEERYRLIADNSMDVIITTDMQLGITYLSPSVRYMIGQTAETIINMQREDRLTADTLGLLQAEADRVKKAIHLLLEHPSKTQVFELAFKHPDGFTGWAEVKMGIMRNRGGQAIGILGIIRDITQQKIMTERLMRSDRLASLSAMAAGLAHEVNNPLTAVMGFAYLLLQNPNVPSEIRNDISSIYNEGKRAADVIKDFLLFARGSMPGKQTVFINDIIESALRLRHSQMAAENITVLLNLAEDLPALSGDVSQLQQALLNIILNAEYFMYQSNKKGTLKLTTIQDDGRIRIYIADDGPGIPKDNIGRIFDPFYTTKQVGEGTGLGLSICYGIISEHGGNIYVESNPGKGATFIIDLPAVI